MGAKRPDAEAYPEAADLRAGYDGLAALVTAKLGRVPPPARGHGPRAQTTLPLVEVTHTLDAADQICPQCGGDPQPWTGQTEDAEEIDVVERSFRVVRHRRQKYRCRCGACIDTALGPPKLMPGGRYSVDFAVGVAVAKYLDHRVPRRYTRTPQGGKGKPCCTRDEGRPLGIGVQDQVPNHLTLRW